jgi:acyl-CoA synthetase (AMP-forming)/AMP-acid ligase II
MGFQSLVDLAEYRAANNSEEIFLSSPEQQLHVTYSSFYLAAKDLAHRLEQCGLSKGEKVALILENGVQWATSFFGIILAGGVVVPLNPRFKPPEIAALLEQAQVQVVITASQEASLLPPDFFRKAVEQGQRNGADPTAVLVISAHERQLAKAVENSDLQLTDEALLLFTSGSTGQPKGVILTHGNLLAEAGFIQQGHHLTSADIVLCILPFFHINGLVITFISTIFSGGKAVVPHKFSAKKFWQWVNEYQVTWVSAVPTILSILLSSGDQAVYSSQLRFVRSASSSLPAAILKEFETRFHVPVIESYGLSETGSQVTTNLLLPGSRKSGSVGLPIGNELCIVDEDDHGVPSGVIGEVIIKGENVTSGYLNNVQANQQSFKGGWFYTGDLGYFDQEGYLFLAGRRKELINRAGEKISPREIDEVLYQLSEIELAAAVGVPDPLFGEEVVAFIQLRPGAVLNENQVICHCQACLADFKIPKRIFFVADFPKGPNGKIQRLKLVELYHKGAVD